MRRGEWFISCNSETKNGPAALTQVLKVTASIIRATALVILLPWIGLVKAEWAPDGRTVICFSDWGVSILVHVGLTQLDIENAISCSCVCLYGLPRLDPSHTYSFLYILTKVGLLLRYSWSSQSEEITSGYAFRPDGRYFVLAERHKSKDTVGVYDATEAYKLVQVSVVYD